MDHDKIARGEYPVGSTEQNSEPDVDAELIAYYDGQRKTSRSGEWVACLDAMIRHLRPH